MSTQSIDNTNQSFWQERTNPQKAGAIAMTLIAIFALVSGGLTLAHIKPFSHSFNDIFQAKNIAIITLGSMSIMGLLAFIFTKVPEKQEGFFNLTRGQKVFLISLVALTIALLTLNTIGVRPFEQDSYANTMNKVGFPGYFATSGVILGISLLMCVYNMKKDGYADEDESWATAPQHETLVTKQPRLDLTKKPLPMVPKSGGQSQVETEEVDPVLNLLQETMALAQLEIAQEVAQLPNQQLATVASQQNDVQADHPSFDLTANYKASDRVSQISVQTDDGRVSIDVGFHSDDQETAAGSVKAEFHFENLN